MPENTRRTKPPKQRQVAVPGMIASGGNDACALSEPVSILLEVRIVPPCEHQAASNKDGR